MFSPHMNGLPSLLEKGSHLVVYGAGGHGRVVADAARAAELEVMGFLDDAVPAGQQVLDWRVLGDLDWLQGRHNISVALGIGANDVRRQVADKLERAGAALATVVHPTAVLSPYAEVGPGVVVFALAVVNVGARIGRGAIVNTGSILEHDVAIGDFAHVASNAALGGNARVGADAMLGTGAVVLPGRAVGDRSIVGAGAVVSRDVAADVVVAGVPARRMNSRATTRTP